MKHLYVYERSVNGAKEMGLIAAENDAMALALVSLYGPECELIGTLNRGIKPLIKELIDCL